jgi:hypothetical protein
MKVYFIHVYKHRWEFYPAEDAAGLETMDVDEEATPTGILHWVAHRAASVRKSIDDADSGVKLRIKNTLERLNSRVDPTEPFLRRLRSAETLEIVHPENVSSRFVQRKLRVLLMRKTINHRRGVVVNGLLLPLSMAATLLPGPNVFFFWNAYRLVSHWLARQGGQRILHGEVNVVYTPSGELDDVPGMQRRRAGPLELNAATHIADRLQLHGFVDYLRRTGGLVTADKPPHHH